MESLTRIALFSTYPPDGGGDLALSEKELPLERHPVAIYLASLAEGSRRTQLAALRLIAIVTGSANELAVPWWQLDHGHTAGIRSKLTERFAPTTSNRMLAALRGVLKTAFRIGLM